LKAGVYLHLFSLAGAPLLCVLLASVVTRTDSASGSLTDRASVVLHASRTSITYPCGSGYHSRSGLCQIQPEVALTSEVQGFHKQAVYKYLVSGGQVVGEGSKVTWDLNGVRAGIYTATVEVQDSNKHRAVSSVNVTVASCSDCMMDCDLPCPAIVVTCYDQVKAGTPITCRVQVQGSSKKCNDSMGWSPEHSAYKWAARSSSGDDLSEVITDRREYVSIPTNGRAGQVIYTMVEIPGLDPTCNSRASSSTRVQE
jgi:hypothetical protein